MKKLLFLTIIFIGCSIMSCSETENDLTIENTLKTKTGLNSTDSIKTDATKTDSTKTGVKVVINEWGDTVRIQQSF